MTRVFDKLSLTALTSKYRQDLDRAPEAADQRLTREEVATMWARVKNRPKADPEREAVRQAAIELGVVRGKATTDLLCDDLTRLELDCLSRDARSAAKVVEERFGIADRFVARGELTATLLGLEGAGLSARQRGQVERMAELLGAGHGRRLAGPVVFESAEALEVGLAGVAQVSGPVTVRLAGVDAAALARVAGALTGVEASEGIHLVLEGCRTEDLSPLKNLRALRSLYLEGPGVQQLEPLRGLTGLEFLYLASPSLRQVAPLAGLTRLKTLYLCSPEVADLSALSGMSGMRRLYLEGRGVEDLAPLAGMKELGWLCLGQTAARDLAPLAGLSSLRTLYLNRTLVTDLAPLSGLKDLELLSLRQTGVADLTPLAGLKKLTQLDLADTPLSARFDVEQLAELRKLQGRLAEADPALLRALGGAEGFAELGAVEQLQLLRVLGLGGAPFATPARASVSELLAADTFRAASAAGQATLLRGRLEEQPWLPAIVAERVALLPDASPEDLAIHGPEPLAAHAFRNGTVAATRYEVVLATGERLAVLFPKGDLATDNEAAHLKVLAEVFASLPPVLRQHLSTLEVSRTMGNTQGWMSVRGLDTVDIQASADLPGQLTADGSMRRMFQAALAHETGHLLGIDALGTLSWGDDGDPAWEPWIAASRADGAMVSRYCAHLPADDMAETVALWAAVRGTEMEQQLRTLLPERMRLLDRLLGVVG